MSGMSKATCTITALLLALLSVSTYVAGAETSRFDGRWQVRYTSSQTKPYEMEFTGDRFHRAWASSAGTATGSKFARRSPEPGAPRPTEFDEEADETMRLDPEDE